MINGKTILNPTVITGGNIGTTMYKPPVGYEPVHVTITWTGDYLDVSYASVYRMYRNSNRLHRVLSTIVNVGFFQGGGTIEFDIDRSYVSYPTGVVVTRDTEGVAVRGVNVESIDVQIEEEHPISDNTIEAVFEGSRANVRLEYTGSISAEYYLNGEKTIATYSGQTDIFIDADAQTPIIFKGYITSFKPVPYSGMYPGSGTDVLSIGGSSDVLLKIDAESCEKLNSIDLDEFANIEEINLYECTELSSVDVTANTKLKILSIGSTQVNSLGLSNNTLLKELFIENTNIQSIDLSNNILLETLDIGNTQIQSIDLSLLSVLKTFLCNGSRLQSLDISSNLQLTTCAVYSCSSMTGITIGENYDLSSGLSFFSCPNISTVTVRGVSQYIADRIAYLIQKNSANAGTVYTNSADPYYSTIKTAADTYGWTVMPLAGSPYNPTATAALISAFRTQMYPICDYGWQHPELVPFINEDPMLIMSLVDGLGTRVIRSNNKAYINTKYIPNSTDDVRLIGYQYSYNEWLFGTRKDTSDYYSFALNLTSSTTVRAYKFCSGASGENITSVQSYAGRIDYETNGNMFVLNGNEYTLPTIVETSINAPVFLMGLNNTSGILQGTSGGGVGLFYIENKRYLCSFKLGTTRTADQVSTGVAQAPGTCGMIDLLTGIFYPNANNRGYFTIEEYPL